MALDHPFCVICFCDLPQPGLCPECKKSDEERSLLMECTICRTTHLVELRPVYDDKEPVCLACWLEFYASDDDKEYLQDIE